MEDLYLDALDYIARFLPPWELSKMALVSKRWYRVIRREKYRKLIAYPFRSKYKLTNEQFRLLASMLERPIDEYKLVHGEVGSGKTWLGVAYMMYRYKEQLKCSVGKPPAMHILIVVPPTCVGQWSEFFEKYTDLPVISNYDSSCFYMSDWEEELTNYGVIICSNLTSGKVADLLIIGKKKFAILHDEAHNSVKVNYHSACEVVGFTASIDTFFHRSKYNASKPVWKIFRLESQILNSALPELEFIEYEPAGFRSEDAWTGVMTCFQDPKYIQLRELDYLLCLLNFGEKTIRFKPGCKMGKKWLGNTNHRENEEYEHARLISIMINVPRMRQLLAVATLVKSKGEKLVIFDVNQFFIIHMLIFFKYHGFDIYPFCTEYNPQSRVKMLEKFKTQGDILIGSIEMLGEGLNIVEANHIAFARYPSTTEEFIQAFGRCHRYPQKKTVYVHMVFSCRLEMFSATQALEGFRKRIKVFRHLAELNEIYDKAEKHKPLPPSLKPHELRLEDYLVKK